MTRDSLRHAVSSSSDCERDCKSLKSGKDNQPWPALGSFRAERHSATSRRSGSTRNVGTSAAWTVAYATAPPPDSSATISTIAHVPEASRFRRRRMRLVIVLSYCCCCCALLAPDGDIAPKRRGLDSGSACAQHNRVLRSARVTAVRSKRVADAAVNGREQQLSGSIGCCDDGYGAIV